MEKSSRPILSAPTKISTLSKPSSFTKHQSKTELSLDSTPRRVMSPLTKSVLLKSSSISNAPTCSISKSNLELSTVKDQYQRDKNGSTTDINLQTEVPTKLPSSFQTGLSPVLKLSCKGNDRIINASEKLSATIKEDKPNSEKGDNLSDFSKEIKATEDSVSIVPSQSNLKGILDAKNLNVTNIVIGIKDDDSKRGTCDKDFETKMLKAVESPYVPDCVMVSDQSNSTLLEAQKSSDSLLDKNENMSQEVLSPPSSQLTPKSVVETSKSSHRTLNSLHRTNETSEISKMSTGTLEALHEPFDKSKVPEKSSDLIKAPVLSGVKTSGTLMKTQVLLLEAPKTHKSSNVNNKIVLENSKKDIVETIDLDDFIDSETTAVESNNNTHLMTTKKDVDDRNNTIKPSVQQGRTQFVSSYDKSPGVLMDITTGQQFTSDSQAKSDTNNKRVRSQLSGWNLFSQSKVTSKGSNKPSKFQSFFSPKKKDKEKWPKMSPKLKSKSMKLFQKTGNVPQIWEIYDIDTPDGTYSATANDLELSNEVLSSEIQGIFPVASEPIILSPSEAEPSDLNKKAKVQTLVNSAVLETATCLHTHKNGADTSGLDIKSDSVKLFEEKMQIKCEENLEKINLNFIAKRSENSPVYEDIGINDSPCVSPEDGIKLDQRNIQNLEILNSGSLIIQYSDSNIVLDNDTPKPPVRRQLSKRQVVQLTKVSSITSGGNSSKEQENIQVSHLSSGSNTQMPTQHQTSNGSSLSTQNNIAPESGIKYKMSQNSSSAKSSVSHLNINSSLLENNVKDVETLPPPIPSPRRRPRRRFSLGPRKLDDDEFIGFASLPEQVHRKAVKRGFEFSLMVVGETGLGKSTLINSLFLTDLYMDRKLPSVQDTVSKTVDISKKSLEIEERGVKLRLSIVDTPGYNDAVNGEECWKNIIDYVDNQFEQYYQAESGLNRKNIQDTRVHCCLYFISPYGHGLKPMDINFMKKLHKKCNIVPLVAKSDILTPKEVKRLKQRILKEIEDNKIEIYQFPDCDSDEDDEFKEQDKALKAAIPFAVVGSNTIVEAGGKRIRGRMYPWGIVEVDNPSHCDFTKLRQMLISTHMQDLKDITSDVHYENYRADHLASQMNKSQKERSKLKRDSVTNIESVVETEKLLQQKEAECSSTIKPEKAKTKVVLEIQRMQAMLTKMQAQLHGGSGQQVNGTVTNTQI